MLAKFGARVGAYLVVHLRCHVKEDAQLRPHLVRVRVRVRV